MTDRYLRFVVDAVTDDGAVHNRMSVDGVWRDEPSTEDCWGRALWGLGVAACCSARRDVREAAALAFGRAAEGRSRWRHSCSFALLGACRMLNSDSANLRIRSLVESCVEVVAHPSPPAGSTWPWPEPCFRYANATIAHAMVLAGASMGDRPLHKRGLELLRFFVEYCERDGHLSLPPATGRGPGARSRGENQQPIEAGAIAHACTEAYLLTGDPYWRDCVGKSWRWFMGENDWNTCMVHPDSHGCLDGLSSWGPNPNQGAESTLAMLSTLHFANRLALARP